MVIINNQPTSVDLLYFKGELVNGGALLEWRTAVEINTYGYYLLRSTTGQVDDAIRINPLIIPAKGTSGGGADYDYLDPTVEPGNVYSYWLVSVDNTNMKWMHLDPVVIPVPAEAPVGDNAIFVPFISK